MCTAYIAISYCLVAIFSSSHLIHVLCSSFTYPLPENEGSLVRNLECQVHLLGLLLLFYLLACSRIDTHGLGCERGGGEVWYTGVKH